MAAAVGGFITGSGVSFALFLLFCDLRFWRFMIANILKIINSVLNMKRIKFYFKDFVLDVLKKLIKKLKRKKYLL